jgi:hypothetical protein
MKVLYKNFWPIRILQILLVTDCCRGCGRFADPGWGTTVPSFIFALLDLPPAHEVATRHNAYHPSEAIGASLMRWRCWDDGYLKDIGIAICPPAGSHDSY